MFPEDAFQFVREGLQHTAKAVHGEATAASSAERPDERRHVSGQQLCLGLRDLAAERYGLLAKIVLNRWGIRKTDDFGTIVYLLIDRGELRQGERDRLSDFVQVFDFDEAFAVPTVLVAGPNAG
jgi:uncharacterized repeat protein (TIGR04138 family)